MAIDKWDKETQRMIDIVEGKKKPKKRSKFLCFFELHKWSKTKMHMFSNSNVKDYEKFCFKCGKKKRWSVHRILED